MELSLEKQLSIRKFNDSVDKLTLEQARELLKDLNRHMTEKDAYYLTLIKDNWGL